ncbi:reverse transcriptase [Caerostris extrusa]|uniref:Reverse transcriptase n=1 Tax=Caerostris extrusa TaxID=172846 RepID=A0AAV4RZE2_CAEEX|nr:reverse transcriptase [Caerostris extrusa]
MLRVDVTSLLESFKFLENAKRSVLSTAAKVFDPVGFLSPFVVKIKRLVQEIWKRGLDWDSKLPEDLESKWKKWCAEIEVRINGNPHCCKIVEVFIKVVLWFGRRGVFVDRLRNLFVLDKGFGNLLRGSRNQWARQKFERGTDEQKLEKLNTSVHPILPRTEFILDENKFSNLGKLLRVTAWVKRFVTKLRKKTCESGLLTAAEIKEAEEYWVRRVQLDNYCSDIQLLKKNKSVPPQSKLYSLVPYVDDREILRVKGRLEQSELFHNEKHPVILPKSKFTDLIIMSEHAKYFHSGVASTLSRVRKISGYLEEGKWSRRLLVSALYARNMH